MTDPLLSDHLAMSFKHYFGQEPMAVANAPIVTHDTTNAISDSTAIALNLGLLKINYLKVRQMVSHINSRFVNTT